MLLIKTIRDSYQFLCFLLFYLSFYISKYHFLPFFRTSFNLQPKKNIFATNFIFLMTSFISLPLSPPRHPFNEQNSLNTKNVIFDTLLLCFGWVLQKYDLYLYTYIYKLFKHSFYCPIMTQVFYWYFEIQRENCSSWVLPNSPEIICSN